MTLTDAIKKIMEDSGKNTSETWKLLKKKLRKNGYSEGGSEYDDVMAEIGLAGAHNILKVWEALDKHINKEGKKWGGRGRYKKQNMVLMRKLCEIDNIEEVIETLGETGYDSLGTWTDVRTYVHLSEDNIGTFKKFAENKLYKKYIQTFNTLKKLGYKDIKSYDTSTQNQLDHLTEISKLDGNPIGAIYILASNGCQIDQVIGISKRDILNIKHIIKEVKNEKGGIPVYLYEKGNIEVFQDYFNSLNKEGKKTALGLILEYGAKEPSKSMEDIQKWIEETHKDILIESGFF